MPSPSQPDGEPGVEIPLPPWHPSFAEEVADHLENIDDNFDADVDASLPGLEGAIAGLEGDPTADHQEMPRAARPHSQDAYSTPNPAPGQNVRDSLGWLDSEDDREPNHHALSRRDSRLRRRWRNLISLRRGPNVLTVSPVFTFPEGYRGRTKILLSTGTNGYGWATEVSRLFSGRELLVPNKQILISHFLANRVLLAMLAERKRKLDPNAAFALVNRRNYLAVFAQAWQTELEKFRDSLLGFRFMGDWRGYCWMVDSRVQVNLKAVEVGIGPFMIVAQEGVESVVLVPERYNARIQPIVIRQY